MPGWVALGWAQWGGRAEHRQYLVRCYEGSQALVQARGC